MRYPVLYRLCHAALAIWLLAGVAGTLRAQETAREQRALSGGSRKLGEFLFSAIRDSRKKLRTGVCRVRETTVLTRRSGETITLGPEYFCAFDYESGLLRFDREATDREEASRYFRTEKESVLYSAETDFMIVLPPSEEAAQEHSVNPIDPRVIGFASLAEQRDGWTFEKMLDLYQQEFELADAQEEKDGRFHLVLSHAPSDAVMIERHLWLDGDRDYVPVRYYYRYFNRKTGAWSGLRSPVETTWVKKANVWVPESVHAVKGDGKRTVSDFEFHWEGVNEGVSESLFQRDSLKAKAGTRIVDVRRGEDKPVALGTVGESERSGLDEPDSKSGRLMRNVVVIGIAVSALAMVLWLWYRGKTAA